MHRIGYSTMTIVRPEFCFGGHYSGFAASNRTETAVPSPIGRNATCQMLGCRHRGFDWQGRLRVGSELSGRGAVCAAAP